MVEGDPENTLVPVMDQRDGGVLEAEALDESEERLAGDRPEDAMEMKRGERGKPSETVEGKLLGKMGANVVDDPVDAFLVLEATNIHDGP